MKARAAMSMMLVRYFRIRSMTARAVYTTRKLPMTVLSDLPLLESED